MTTGEKWTYVDDRIKIYFNSNLCSYAINYSDVSWEFQWVPREFGTHFLFCFDGISTPKPKTSLKMRGNVSPSKVS